MFLVWLESFCLSLSSPFFMKKIKFKTFNTRRNLPKEIGNKRGESNFLGAFERYLISNVTDDDGLIGRNFYLFNYGIADLVYWLPQKKELYAFELKLHDWKRAFQQAYRYSYYSDYSFVVLPEKNKAIDNIDLFKFHGIGLWIFDKKNSLVEKMFTPNRNYKNLIAHNNAIKAILRRAISK